MALQSFPGALDPSGITEVPVSGTRQAHRHDPTVVAARHCIGPLADPVTERRSSHGSRILNGVDRRAARVRHRVALGFRFAQTTTRAQSPARRDRNVCDHGRVRSPHGTLRRSGRHHDDCVQSGRRCARRTTSARPWFWTKVRLGAVKSPLAHVICDGAATVKHHQQRQQEAKHATATRRTTRTKCRDTARFRVWRAPKKFRLYPLVDAIFRKQCVWTIGQNSRNSSQIEGRQVPSSGGGRRRRPGTV